MARYSSIHDLTGLTSLQAAHIFRDEGPNELPSSKRRSKLKIAYDVMREPMFLLLVACGAVYFILGDTEEAIMLLAFVFFVMGITLYQEGKTERALEALRDLSSPRALVIRDGKRIRIAGREVVRGDIILLSEGDRVPADALLLDAVNLVADESLLTGESVPVRKSIGEITAPAQPGGDDVPFVFSGTLVVRGQGVARVVATGKESAIGRIGGHLQTVRTEESPLQQETARLVRGMASAVLALCVLLVVIYGVKWGQWLSGVLAGLTLAMAVMPNELPVVLTIFVALGAWRLSLSKVLVRHPRIVEALGSATVLCVDNRDPHA